MSVEIVVPALGELVTEATVAKWFKQVGDAVAADEPLVELETDKVTVEVNAPSAGTLCRNHLSPTGEVGQCRRQAGRDRAKGPAPRPRPSPLSAPAANRPPPRQLPRQRRKPPPPLLLVGAAPSAAQDDGREGAGGVRRPRHRQGWPHHQGRRITALDRPAPAPVVAKAPAAPRAPDAREVRVRMTRLRKRIAERLKEAQNTAAMLTTFNEVDLTL